jgi:phosphoribosyl 1,2-cyclic phosphodiesterase
MKITFLGTGTSTGVPSVGCPCDVCHSRDPRDKRLRASVLLEYGGRCVVVDTGSDFRQQALRVGLTRLDAVLFTHDHADHIFGLDDIRPFNFRTGQHVWRRGGTRVDRVDVVTNCVTTGQDMPAFAEWRCRDRFVTEPFRVHRLTTTTSGPVPTSSELAAK